MTKLENLYTGIKKLEEAGLELTEDQLKLVDELEEQLIRTEVLPALSKDIEPRLTQIQRELVLVVEFRPGEPISVALSRKRNITQMLNAKRLDIDPSVDHKEYGPRTHSFATKGPRTGLVVYRRDGSIIQERNAAATFVKAIKEAGPLRVRGLNLKLCKINLVSTTKDKMYGMAQHEVQPGLFVMTHCDNHHKQKRLQQISEALNLGWRVEIIY